MARTSRVTGKRFLRNQGHDTWETTRHARENCPIPANVPPACGPRTSRRMSIHANPVS